jgi:hypothetical protein
MLSALLREHYGLDGNLQLLDSHFGTEIYRCGQYVVKTLPLSHGARMEREGHVTEFLGAQGIPEKAEGGQKGRRPGFGF